ncbi:MAG: hypothetical protein RL003_1523 [Bacteroidota bacterium]
MLNQSFVIVDLMGLGELVLPFIGLIKKGHTCKYGPFLICSLIDERCSYFPMIEYVIIRKSSR